MYDVTIVGGGPAGLSTALFSAKNDLETALFDTDQTTMHYAHLFNYPGIMSIEGDEWLTRTREQVDEFDVERYQGDEVASVDENGDGFVVATDDTEYATDYVVFATGTNRTLATELGCEANDDETIDVNLMMETSIDNVYATGAMVRDERWEAVISSGDGAAAALDILSKKNDKKFRDFDADADAYDI